MIHFKLEKCKTKAAYSATLQTKGELALTKIKQAFETTLETPILLVVKVKDVEVIVHKYGELLFKHCKDEELMREIADKIYEVGEMKNDQQ